MSLRLWLITLSLVVASRVEGGVGVGAIITTITIVMIALHGTTMAEGMTATTSLRHVAAMSVIKATAGGVAATEPAGRLT